MRTLGLMGSYHCRAQQLIVPPVANLKITFCAGCPTMKKSARQYFTERVLAREASESRYEAEAEMDEYDTKELGWDFGPYPSFHHSDWH